MSALLSQPGPWTGPALAACLLALLTALATVLTQRWHGFLSHDSRAGIQKFHDAPTPRVGGIAIVLGLLSGYAAASDAQQAMLGPLLLCGLTAFVAGLLEDCTKRISVRARLLGTMTCGVLAWVATGQTLTSIDVPLLDDMLSFTPLAVLFTAFAVSGVANAVNMIDGFNGLAAGTAIIILAGMAGLASQAGDSEIACTCQILIGAVMGFGLVNWPLGKIFLGDGGAYFIGFALAWIAVLIKVRNPGISAWAPMLLCAYPVLEVLFSMKRRVMLKLSPCDPDRLHLHSLVRQRLLDRLLPEASDVARNSVTGACMWIVASVPVLAALQWSRQTWLLAGSFAVCACLYYCAYSSLSRGCWQLKSNILPAGSTASARPF